VQEGGRDGLVGRELAEVDGDEKLLGLLVDITNIDTTLVSEVNPIALKRQCQRSDRAMIGRTCSSRGQIGKSRNTRARAIEDAAMQVRKGKMTCENGRARVRNVCAPREWVASFPSSGRPSNKTASAPACASQISGRTSPCLPSLARCLRLPACADECLSPKNTGQKLKKLGEKAGSEHTSRTE
jgi:hypothetical protein